MEKSLLATPVVVVTELIANADTFNSFLHFWSVDFSRPKKLYCDPTWPDLTHIQQFCYILQLQCLSRLLGEIIWILGSCYEVSIVLFVW